MGNYIGYLKIPNLYSNTDILQFKKIWALEKIDGTSSHISFNENKLGFFSGGASYTEFCKLFDAAILETKFKEISEGRKVIVYGEAYGGKLQGMSKTYGPNLKFAAFDVQIDDVWLNVPHAEAIVKQLGLEFVHYTEISTDLVEIDKARDADSQQAIRNGIGPGKIMEGVILRPLIEVTKNNGNRIIAKHKRDEFRETNTPRKVVDAEKWKIMQDAKTIADEYVVFERLKHVQQKIGLDFDMKNTKAFIDAMCEDIKIEADKEIVWSSEVASAIGKNTAILLKRVLAEKLAEISSGV